MQEKGEAIVVAEEVHPRKTSPQALTRLKAVVRPDGTVALDNASGINDGARALLLAGDPAAARHGLTPRPRVASTATAG